MKIPIKRFIKNAYIYLSGQTPPKAFYIIKSGQVKITKTNPILGVSEDIRNVGYIFGIIQCITGISEDETAEAVTDCEIFVINKEKIEDIFINHKKVILKILSEYSEILRKLDSDLINYNFFPDTTDRKEKIFDVAKKYLQLKQEDKAAHLLKSLQYEYSDDKMICDRAAGFLSKLPEPSFIENEGIIFDTTAAENTVIFTEFEKADNFYIIRNGKIRITKLRHDKEILLAILGEGDIFGEMSVLNDKPRNATATTLEETNFMVIDKKGINKLPPPLFRKLLEFLSKRIWFVQQQLICYKLPVSIAKFYYMLSAKIKQVLHDIDSESSNSFVFKFSVDELYQMIDFDIKKEGKESLRDFYNDSNIEFYKDSIKVRNIRRLFDKNSYHFSRALIIYNSQIDEV